MTTGQQFAAIAGARTERLSGQLASTIVPKVTSHESVTTQSYSSAVIEPLDIAGTRQNSHPEAFGHITADY